ncbi:hypothetical protein M569_07109, partial [Genlisea aurea]
RLRTCQEYVDREGVSQQSLVINAPSYHRKYILPWGETMQGAVGSKSKYQRCSSIEDKDHWHHLKNAIRATMQHTMADEEEVRRLLSDLSRQGFTSKGWQQQ